MILIAGGRELTNLMGKRAAPAQKKQKEPPAPKRGKKQKTPEESEVKEEQKNDKKKDPPMPPFHAVNSKKTAAFFNVAPDVLVPGATHAQKKAQVQEDPPCPEPPLSFSAADSEQAASSSAGGSATNASSGVDATAGLVQSKWGNYAVPGEGGPSWICDRADPAFHSIYKQCREHRMFPYYMMAISDTHDPRTKDNGWCWTYNDPLGELHDFNNYMFTNGYEPFDISKIPWKKNTGETKQENAVVGETAEQKDLVTNDTEQKDLVQVDVTPAEVADVGEVTTAEVHMDVDEQTAVDDQSTEVAAAEEATVVSSTKDDESTEVAGAGEALEQPIKSEAATSDQALAVQRPSTSDATAEKTEGECEEKTEVPSDKAKGDEATEVPSIAPEQENTRKPWTLDRLLEFGNIDEMMHETCQLSDLSPHEFESVMSDIRAHPKFSEVVKRVEDDALDADLSAEDQWRFGVNPEDVGEDIESWCGMYFEMYASGRVVSLLHCPLLLQTF